MNFFPVSYDTLSFQTTRTTHVNGNGSGFQNLDFWGLSLFGPDTHSSKNECAEFKFDKCFELRFNFPLWFGHNFVTILSNLQKMCSKERFTICVVMVLSVILHGVESHAYHEFSHEILNRTRSWILLSRSIPPRQPCGITHIGTNTSLASWWTLE